MRALAILTLTLAALATPAGDYASIKSKFAQIQKQKLRPGTRIALTQGELNAYVQRELPQVAPPGIRNPVVTLEGDNTATGKARIDFVKLRNAQGKPPGLILRTLLGGEHEIAVTATVRSSGGKATVDVKSVAIEGIPVSGSALDFLIENYLIPNYPDAKVGRPFELKYRIDRIEVARNAAYVVTR
jgi:hypothetical protein